MDHKKTAHEILSALMGIKDEGPSVKNKEQTDENMLPETKDSEILSLINGKAIALEDVLDATFAEGVLGQGAAVEPAEGKVVAPVDGTVATLFDTHHAIGLNLDNGVELLIHIGINTVELHGEGFTAHVSEGGKVKKGQTLITFDREFIASRGYNAVTPVIVSNSDDYAEVKRTADGDVTYRDVLLKLVKE